MTKMTKYGLQIVAALLLIIGGTTVKADDQGEFDGVYRGTMTITIDPVVREVPLQLSLVFTGDTATLPNGDTVPVINGSFLVDGEGGAYAFKKIDFDISNSHLDMRYVRPMIDMNDETPSSFRLVGDYLSDGSISGRVLSANRGPIGTFALTKTEQITFDHKHSYQGQWRGSAIMTDGGSVPMTLRLVDAEGATVNPADMEFEYTPAKFANIRWNNLRFSANNVSIDYLRGVISMKIPNTSSAPGLSIEYRIDPRSGAANGVIKSALRGQTATFELQPVAQPPL